MPDHGDRHREGFDPDQGAHLFERFYRGDSSRTASGAGSGIGLTIAKAIVTAHHGALKGHSDGPGKGARFEITLPLAAHNRWPPRPSLVPPARTTPGTTSPPRLCRTDKASLLGRA